MFYVDKDASAYPTLFTVLCGITAAVFAMQVLTATTLILSDIKTYSLFAKIMVPASLCLLILSILWFKVLVKRGRVETYSKKEKLIEFDIKQYHHPMEKI